MALNDVAVSILQLPLPAAALTMTPSAGHCVSRISSATRHPLPASVRCSTSTCDGAGRRLRVWHTTSGPGDAYQVGQLRRRRPYLQRNCPVQRSHAARGGRASRFGWRLRA